MNLNDLASEARPRSTSGRPRNPRRTVARIACIEVLEGRTLCAIEVAPISAIEGVAFEQTVATFQAGDVQDPGEVNVDWGDGESSSGRIEQEGDEPFRVVAGHTYSQAGQFLVKVTVQGSDKTLEGVGTATVAPSTIVVTPSNFNAIAGQPAEVVVATFVDPNASEEANDFFARVSSDGGMAGFGNIVEGATPGTFVVKATMTFPETGVFDVEVAIGEVAAPAQTTTVTAKATVTSNTLQAAGTTFTAVVGTPWTEVVATFLSSDPDAEAADFRASVDFGDETTGLGVITKNDAGFEVRATHTYTAAGNYPVSVMILGADNGAELATAKSQAQVAAANFPAAGTTFMAVAGTAWTRNVATFKSSDPDAKESDFRASVEFGDGTSGLGTITRSGSDFVVRASHTYSTPGNFVVSVTIAKAGDGTELATVTSQAQVAAASSPTAPTNLQFQGAVDPSYVSPRSNASRTWTTSTNPLFVGSALPYSMVFLYGRRFDHKESTLLARAATGVDGAWSAQVGPLPDGPYVITAVVSSAGPGEANPALSKTFVLYGENTPLIVDTVGLSVVRVVSPRKLLRAPRRGEKKQPRMVYVVFRQDASGIDEATLMDSQNYLAFRPPLLRGLPIKPVVMPSIYLKNTSQVIVQLRFKQGLRPHTTLQISGVRDVAGNELRGVFAINNLPRLTDVPLPG